MFIGFDCGILIYNKEGKSDLGFSSRILGSFVFGHPYVRLDIIPSVETMVEFGILLKLPLPID